MIISEKKPLAEIRASLVPYERIAIIGCGGCAAVCQTGGTKQVEEMAQALDGKQIVFTFQIDEPCDQRILARELRRVSGRLERAEAVLILACGIGVQSIALAVDKPCLTGLDTAFAGMVAHSNSYAETCLACGEECLLNVTAGICPRTRCPKGIINGPCSEKTDELCSVDSDAECVWVSIERRLEALGLPPVETEFPATDWTKRMPPRTIGLRKV